MRNSHKNQIELTLIRHGSTPGNIQKRYIGRTDEELSQEGKAQILKAYESHLYRQPDLLFSSPMKRCIETSELLFPGMKMEKVEDWRELDFGEFEGKNYMELSGDDRYQAWIDSGGTLAFPQGESREAFVDRTCRAFEKLLPTFMQDVDRVTAVVHGGSIMALLSHYAGGDYFDYQVANGEGYKMLLTLESCRETELGPRGEGQIITSISRLTKLECRE